MGGRGASAGTRNSKSIPSQVSKMSEPNLFSSTTVKVNGKGADRVTFKVSNMGSKRWSAEISINGGKAGRFESKGLSSFSEAKKSFSSLYSRYESSATRFKGKNLSSRDLSDLTRT